MQNYKKFIVSVLLIPLPFMLALFALLYVYDPYMLFHKPYFREVTFKQDMRLMARFIVDNYTFDSAILGTSMLENTSAKEAGEKLGGKWMNLSLAGSTLAERAIILEYLLKKKNIQAVIYSLDAFALAENRINNTNFKLAYNDNPQQRFGLYLNKDIILCALQFSTKEKCVGTPITDLSLEDFTKWALKEEYKMQFGGFENWLKSKDEKFKKGIIEPMLNHKGSFFVHPQVDTEIQRANVKKDLLTLISSHPNTTFHFLIPTYSRMLYSINAERGEFYSNKDFILFSKYQDVLKWLIQLTKDYSNVKIYGFDDLDYADDIANYKDPSHYNVDMNSMQLDAIANQMHILTPQNMDEYFKIMATRIKDYNLEPFIQQVKQYVESQK